MAERTDLPKIKPTEAPSLFNHEAGKWGAVGGLVASTAAALHVHSSVKKQIQSMIAEHGIEALHRAKLDGKALLSSGRKMIGLLLGVELVGGFVGGLFGKSQQEKDVNEGRTVKTPGYWNKGILSGWLAVAIPVQIISLFRTNEANVLDMNFQQRKSIYGFIAVVGGAIVGSIMRKNSLQKDFDQAVALRDQQQAQLIHGAAKAQQPGYMNSVNTSEAAELAQKQAAKNSSHADAAQQAAAASEPQRA
jgi:hypothetical protein